MYGLIDIMKIFKSLLPLMLLVLSGLAFLTFEGWFLFHLGKMSGRRSAEKTAVEQYKVLIDSLKQKQDNIEELRRQIGSYNDNNIEMNSALMDIVNDADDSVHDCVDRLAQIRKDAWKGMSHVQYPSEGAP